MLNPLVNQKKTLSDHTEKVFLKSYAPHEKVSYKPSLSLSEDD